MLIRVARPEDWELVRDVRLRALGDDPDAFCSTVEDERLMAESQWRARSARSHIALAVLDR